MAECQFVIQQCLFYLNNRHKLKTEELAKISPTAEFYEPKIHKTDYGDPWKQKVYSLNDSYPVDVVTIFNPLEYRRTEVIKLMVTSPSIMVSGCNKFNALKSLQCKTIEIFRFLPWMERKFKAKCTRFSRISVTFCKISRISFTREYQLR